MSRESIVIALTSQIESYVDSITRSAIQPLNQWHSIESSLWPLAGDTTAIIVEGNEEINNSQIGASTPQRKLKCNIYLVSRSDANDNASTINNNVADSIIQSIYLNPRLTNAVAETSKIITIKQLIQSPGLHFDNVSSPVFSEGTIQPPYAACVITLEIIFN